MQGNMGQGQMFSTTDFMRLVMKIFGLLAIIFIGIAIAVPWAGYTIPGTNYGLSLNGWGVSTSIPESLVGSESYKLLSDPFYINTMQAGITEGTVASICMILVFIFTILTLLISIKAFRSIGTGGVNKTYLFAGIFVIITMVLCVIAVSQANSYGTSQNYYQGGSSIIGGFGYTWGFILAIIAMIFFFINYGLDIFLLQSGMGMQRRAPYQQQQPQMMYTSQQPPVQQPPVQQTPIPQTQQTEQPPMAGMACPKCGVQLQAGAKFCPGCGAKI
jgi:hypothetical protein